MNFIRLGTPRELPIAAQKKVLRNPPDSPDNNSSQAASHTPEYPNNASKQPYYTSSVFSDSSQRPLLRPISTPESLPKEAVETLTKIRPLTEQSPSPPDQTRMSTQKTRRFPKLLPSKKVEVSPLQIALNQLSQWKKATLEQTGETEIPPNWVYNRLAYNGEPELLQSLHTIFPDSPIKRETLGELAKKQYEDIKVLQEGFPSSWEYRPTLSEIKLLHNTREFNEILKSPVKDSNEAKESLRKLLALLRVDEAARSNPNYDTLFHEVISNLFHDPKEGNNRELAKLLMEEFGVNINVRKGEEQYTAIHRAIERGDFWSVKMLVKGGADLKVTDAEGLTPLARARKKYEDIDNIVSRYKAPHQDRAYIISYLESAESKVEITP